MARKGQHTLKLGGRHPGDTELYSQEFRKGDKFFSTVSHTFGYRARDDEEITAVVAEDQWSDDTGGIPVLVSGGVGQREVTIEVTSQRNRGFHFHFYVYGVRKTDTTSPATADGARLEQVPGISASRFPDMLPSELLQHQLGQPPLTRSPPGQPPLTQFPPGQTSNKWSSPGKLPRAQSYAGQVLHQTKIHPGQSIGAEPRVGRPPHVHAHSQFSRVHSYDQLHRTRSVGDCHPTVQPVVSSPPYKGVSSYAVKVTHLSPNVTTEMLEKHFSAVGELAGLPIIHELASRYAHVNFRSQLGAETAISTLNGSILDGWKINVKRTGSIQTATRNFESGVESDMKTLKVSNLPPDIQEKQLFEHFGQFGAIDSSSCIFRTNPDSPYAYINYFSSGDARRAASDVAKNMESFGESRQLKIQIQQSRVQTGTFLVDVTPKSKLQQPSSFRRQRANSGPVVDSHTPKSLQSLQSYFPAHELVTKDCSTPDLDICVAEVASSSHELSKACGQNDTDGTQVQFSNHNDHSAADFQNDSLPELTSPKLETSDEDVQPTENVLMEFKVNSYTNQANFRKYLKSNLDQEVPFIVSMVSPSQAGSVIEVWFTCLSDALSSRQKIKECDPSIQITFRVPDLNIEGLEKSVTSFKESIERKRCYYLSAHSRVVDELKQQHEALVLPKRCTLDTHRKIVEQRKVLKQVINERECQQKEFEVYCEQLQRGLNISVSLCEGAQNVAGQVLLSRLCRDFGAECNRFAKALPIYARRNEIVKTVQENQVCILIGETGSGKSTQLVQYLYDAGFSKGGNIVCTQPRKVAAISLAKHVSTEMGETRVGELLGYKTGVRGRFSDQTKVLYMTDHTLLNECISDPTFAKYSCLIIDEAHERSLSTDILLAFIKRCLEHRPDLRVIITSATIDPDLFVRYFGGKCPVITVPGRTFPVDIVWNPLDTTELPIERQYVADAVKLVCDLHATEPPGDILVFLPSPLDIERACQQTTDELNNEALILPLHGKLQPDEQQKVFSEDHEQRKIIFATNIAETSVTIPGVKYVVDTGLAKELCFDPKRNMNSLEVRVISKSSAEQRKGRAGRTSAGKCYRLYSEELFNDMPNKMLPEILRVALASAVLKLYEFGVSDILSFQFVEPPDPIALKSAVDNLMFLGAVKHDRLTELGKRMAALPMDPHLAKILFDGINAGVGFEAAISVAISMLAGSVFFRAGTDEMKQESDMQRITFLHPAGDQITYLQTYCEWSSQPKEHQNQWCVDKYINAKSMRMINESVSEVRDILQNRFQIMLSQNINFEFAEQQLPKLYFYTFIRNLCVFLGHERVGYLNSRLPDEQLIIFPGSSLRQLNDVPLYLVYEKTLRTSQHFMLQVLPVKEEWIQEAVAKKLLSSNPSQSAIFIHLKVSPLIIENIGSHVMKKVFEQKQDILNEMEFAEIQPMFDTSFKKVGKLVVYLQFPYHERFCTLLQGEISSIRDVLGKEVLECGISKEDDDVRVMLGSGGRISRILMPHEYRTVIVKGPKHGQWQDEMLPLLQTCGPIQSSVYKELKSDNRFFVTFQNPGNAMSAVTSMELPEGVFIEPQLFCRQGGATVSSFTLQIEFVRRARRNFGFINFHHEEDRAIAFMNLRSGASIGGSHIKFKPSKRDVREIFMTNVGLHLSEQDVKQQLHIPGVAPEHYDVKLGREKAFKTPPEYHAALKEELEKHVSSCATKGNYKVELLPPEDFHVVYRGYITFKNPEEGQRTLQRLVHQTVGDKNLSVKPNLSSIVRYSPNIYGVMKDSIQRIAKEIQERYNGSVTVKHDKIDKGGNVLIKICANDVAAFIAARHALNTVINPEVIESCTPELREFMYTANCKAVLSKIEKETNTLIHIDYRTASIKMYGEQANVSQAKIKFNASLSVLTNGARCYEIRLKNPGMPPGIMKHLVAEFGLGLQSLEEKDGVRTARLDPQRQILTIVGTVMLIKQFQRWWKNILKVLVPNLMLYILMKLSAVCVSLQHQILLRSSDQSHVVMLTV